MASMHKNEKLRKFFSRLVIMFVPDYFIELKGLEAKGPFLCLGLRVRFKRAYRPQKTTHSSSL